MRKSPTETPTARLIMSTLYQQGPGLEYQELAQLTGMCLQVIKKTVRRLEEAKLVGRDRSSTRTMVYKRCYDEFSRDITPYSPPEGDQSAPILDPAIDDLSRYL
jgi:transcription initiation factor IIE alpha subunit